MWENMVTLVMVKVISILLEIININHREEDRMVSKKVVVVRFQNSKVTMKVIMVMLQDIEVNIKVITVILPDSGEMVRTGTNTGSTVHGTTNNNCPTIETVMKSITTVTDSLTLRLATIITDKSGVARNFGMIMDKHGVMDSGARNMLLIYNQVNLVQGVIRVIADKIVSRGEGVEVKETLSTFR